MTQEELFAQLAPIRIPVGFAEFTYQDALLALAAGIVLGLLVSQLFGAITARKQRPADLAQAEIDRLGGEAPHVRMLGLAELLKHYAPESMGKLGLDSALYDPSRSVDLDSVEKAILVAAKKAKDA